MYKKNGLEILNRFFSDLTLVASDIKLLNQNTFIRDFIKIIDFQISTST